MAAFKVVGEKVSTIDGAVVGGDVDEIEAPDADAAREVFLSTHKVMSGLADWRVKEVNQL